MLNDALESGVSLRDAVADMFKKHKRVIFCGNGYSAEWPIEAKKRGLPNLKVPRTTRTHACTRAHT